MHTFIQDRVGLKRLEWNADEHEVRPYRDDAFVGTNLVFVRPVYVRQRQCRIH